MYAIVCTYTCFFVCAMTVCVSACASGNLVNACTHARMHAHTRVFTLWAVMPGRKERRQKYMRTFVSFCSACSAFSLYREMSFFCCWIVLCKLAMVLRNSLHDMCKTKSNTLVYIQFDIVIHEILLRQLKTEMWKRMN